MSRRIVLILFFVAAIVTSGAVSYWASRNPDGLEKTAGDHGLLAKEAAATPTAPLAEYKVAGISSEFLSNGAAGVCGAMMVLGATLLLGRWVRRPRLNRS